MQKLVALVLIFVVFLVTAALNGLGLPIWPAVYLGFLITGFVAMVVEHRLGRYPPAVGMAFMILGGLVGIGVGVKAVPQVSGWVVGPAAVVIQIAALVVLIRIYRALVARGYVARRRRLARRRGWSYAPQAEVPVPGPRSAPRFTAVPNDALATTGRDVISATVNGFAVTVFDRVRPHESNGEVQTVWLVRLPMTFPYLDFSSLGYASAQERAQLLHPDDPAFAAAFVAVMQQMRGSEAPGDFTDNAAFAQELMAPQVRDQAIRLGTPFWIENAYLCAVDKPGERTGAAAREVERVVDALTTFAAEISWTQLAPYARRA